MNERQRKTVAEPRYFESNKNRRERRTKQLGLQDRKHILEPKSAFIIIILAVILLVFLVSSMIL